MVFDAFKIYFNELEAGLSGGINFDTSFHFNSDSAKRLDLETSLGLSTCRYIARDFLQLVLDTKLGLIEDYTKGVNLMELIPKKFHSSIVLQDFIDVCDITVGSWLSKVNDIEKLLDKYSVSEDYIQNLADLVGFELINFENITLEEKRRQLDQVIDWYKRKGLYKSLPYVAYAFGYKYKFWDMYTDDYTTFIPVEWFVGDEGENPTGLDSSYYKSPHFGFEIKLEDLYFTETGYLYLFSGTTFNNFSNFIEEIKPINTVPHYSLLLEPITFELDQRYLVLPQQVRTVLVEGWQRVQTYFNGGAYFNNGVFFNQRDSSLVDEIVTWRLGTGNKDQAPNTDSFALENVVLTGTISASDKYFIEDCLVIEFIVPKVNQAGVSELGLFTNAGLPAIYSTFPDIDLIDDLNLKISVKVYTGVTPYWIHDDTSRLGSIGEVGLDENIQKIWYNAYSTKYNSQCLSAKSSNRFDTWEMDWDTVEEEEYEWDFPIEVGCYSWYDTEDTYIDVGSILTDVVLIYSQQAIKAAGAIEYMETSTSVDGITWSDWQIYYPTITTFRYVKTRGYVVTASQYAGYLYYNSTFMAITL